MLTDRKINNYCLAGTPPKDIYLQIVPVTLHVNERSYDTYALLDNGSQSTLLKKEVVDKLGLLGRKKAVNLSTIKDKSETVQVTEVALDVSARDGGNRITIDSAYVQPTNKFNMPARPRFADINDEDIYTHLDGLNLDAVAPDEIAILIGANAPEALLYTDVRRGNKGQPLAVKTMFGWALFGP